MPQDTHDALARRSAGTALLNRASKWMGAVALVAVAATAAVLAHSLPGRSTTNLSAQGSANSASSTTGSGSAAQSAPGALAPSGSAPNSGASVPAVTSGGS